MVFGLTPAASAQKPDWLQGSSKQYPQQLYLVGVGSGKTLEAAENQARASIARTFRIDINATTGVQSSEVMKQDKDGVTAESQQKTVTSVEVGVQKTMEGIEIAEVYDDAGITYALAVLKRSSAQAILEDQIHRLDEDIVTLGKSADEATDKIERLRLMLRRKNHMVVREELNTDYRVVDLANQSIPAPFSIEKEKSKIASFLKNEFLIGVTATGEESQKILQPALKYLSSKGFSAKKMTPGNEGAADVVISLETDLDASTEPVDEWYYCRWTLDATAMDRKTGNNLVNESKSGKAGQLSVKNARKKAVTEMTNAATAVMESVWNTLSGEEQE
jgi:chaperonin cofactor prefoldin